MFEKLKEINKRPSVFGHYTAADLWTNKHTSEQMLKYHLNGAIDVSSRKFEFIDRSVDWMISRFGLNKDKCVADFGCGPGLYTTRLAKSGADITGIDFSERSIDYAKEQAQQNSLSIDYVHADYLEFETEKRFDLITMIMCDFCALSPDQRQTMLIKFKKHLKPNGALVFDVYSLTAFKAKEENASYAENLLDGFWSSEPYYGFLNSFKYNNEKVVLDKYSIVEENRTRVVYNWLQHFDQTMLKKEIESCGLVVDEFVGNVAGDPYDSKSSEFAVIASRSK